MPSESKSTDVCSSLGKQEHLYCLGYQPNLQVTQTALSGEPLMSCRFYWYKESFRGPAEASESAFKISIAFSRLVMNLAILHWFWHMGLSVTTIHCYESIQETFTKYLFVSDWGPETKKTKMWLFPVRGHGLIQNINGGKKLKCSRKKRCDSRMWADGSKWSIVESEWFKPRF